MPAKMLPRRAATYPETCLAGPIGQFQEQLRGQEKLRDIHDLATRMERLAGKWNLDSDKTELFVQWSLYQWVNSHKPVFVLEEDLAWSLANTEPPMEQFDLLPEIPIDGMYISLPPVFELGGEVPGIYHKIEGIFLTRNEVLVPKSGEALSGPVTQVTRESINLYDIVPSITVLGVGEDLRPPNKRQASYLRDDLVIYFSLVPNKPLYLPNDKHHGLAELTRVVTNLLYLLQNTKELSQVQDPPLPESLFGDSRTARRERERNLQKGRSCLRHTVWKLSTLKRKTPTKPDKTLSSEEKKVRGHIVLGHIHRYWVVDPGDEKVLQTKTAHHTKGPRTYHLVAKWVLPYMRGEGPVEKSPKVILRK